MRMVEIFKALSDETRTRIFNLLLAQELCVCDIETVLNISQTNASRHLAKLKTAGIVEMRKEYQWAYYKINEQFKLEHKLLIDYAKNILDTDNTCKLDTERLKSYREGGRDCKS